MIKILHDLSLEMRESPENKDMAQHALEVLEAGTGFEYLAVLIPATDGEGLRPLALSKQGQDADFLKRDRDYVEWRCANVTDGLTNWVAQNGESIRSGNVVDDERYLGIRDDIRSELCVPLRVGKHVMGVLNTETTRPNAYDASDQRFLETAATHFALAVTHSHGRYRFAKGCSYCSRMRDRDGHWLPPADYLFRQTGILASHGVCPSCHAQVMKNDRH